MNLAKVKILIATLILVTSTSTNLIEDELNSVSKTDNDLWVPTIGVGTAALGNSKTTICEALSLGFRLFDTAQATEWYNESELGDALQECWNEEKLGELVIVTKIHPRSFTAAVMENALKMSMQYIYKKDRQLDIVLLHAPFCYTWWGCTELQNKELSWKTAWLELENHHNKNIIKSIGVSNFDSNLLIELLQLASNKVSVVQNWMDPFHQDIITRDICARNGIIYMAYSSLGTQWEMRSGGNPVLTNPVLINIGHKHNKSVAQVVQSWLLQENVIAIPRSNQRKHLEENAYFLSHHGSSQVFLDTEDMLAIKALDGTYHN